MDGRKEFPLSGSLLGSVPVCTCDGFQRRVTRVNRILLRLHLTCHLPLYCRRWHVRGAGSGGLRGVADKDSRLNL